MNKTTSQNLWFQLLRIAVLINELIRINSGPKILRSAPRSAGFFLRRQPKFFENVTLVARWRVYFRGFLAIFLVAQLPLKKVL